MKRTVLFILYHPTYVGKYEHLSATLAGKAYRVLVVCGHPYFNDDVMNHCRGKFDRIIVLPATEYSANILRTVTRTIRFLRSFSAQTGALLAESDRFDVIFNLSAYLPVNCVISKLKKHPRAGMFSCIADFPVYDTEADIFRSAYTLLLNALFGIAPVYFDRKMTFMYFQPPYTRLIRFSSPAEPQNVSCPGGLETEEILQPLAPRGTSPGKVIFYGDTTVFDVYGCSLTKKEYALRMREFLRTLRERYRGCAIIYKPHPNNEGSVMEGIRDTDITVYRGGLPSDLHLESGISDVKACYSVCSTSLLYSAYRGIPSYALYRLAGFQGKYPADFFERGGIARNPFLKIIDTFDEVGCIDNAQL